MIRVVTISGRSPPVRVRERVALAPMLSNVVLCSRQSLKFGMDREISNPLGAITFGTTRRSCSATGSGRSSTPFTTLKIEVLAAMPSAIVRTAINGEARTLAQHPDGEA